MRRTLAQYAWLGLVPVAAGLVAHQDWAWVDIGRAAGVGLAGGLAGGLIAGAIGLISVPLITLFLGIPVHHAVATNLFQTIFTAGNGAATHARLGNVDLRLAAPLLLGSLFGAPLGAWTGIGLSEVVLRNLFAVILLAMAANLVHMMIRGRRRPRWTKLVEVEEGEHWWSRPIKGTFRGHTYHIPRFLPVLLGAGIGFVSGLLGIGGGFLVTPLVASILHVPTHLAVGTGLVVISGNSIFGVAPHVLAGNVLWTAGILIAIGGAIGAQLGSRLSHHIPARVLHGLFLVTVLVVAWRMAAIS